MIKQSIMRTVTDWVVVHDDDEDPVLIMEDASYGVLVPGHPLLRHVALDSVREITVVEQTTR